MTATLKNNAFALNRAIESERHCQPGAMVCRDGHHKGTIFAWHENKWHVTDIENREYLGGYLRLAVVTLAGDADPENGLNQHSLGIDLECSEWIIDADELEGLQEAYGDDLEVVWEQE